MWHSALCSCPHPQYRFDLACSLYTLQSVICTISHINDPHHLITFAATLPSSLPSSALITILPFTSLPLRPLCILSAFINAIIHLRPFFDRPPIIYVVLSFRA